MTSSKRQKTGSDRMSQNESGSVPGHSGEVLPQISVLTDFMEENPHIPVCEVTPVTDGDRGHLSTTTNDVLDSQQLMVYVSTVSTSSSRLAERHQRYDDEEEEERFHEIEEEEDDDPCYDDESEEAVGPPVRSEYRGRITDPVPRILTSVVTGNPFQIDPVYQTRYDEYRLRNEFANTDWTDIGQSLAIQIYRAKEASYMFTKRDRECIRLREKFLRVSKAKRILLDLWVADCSAYEDLLHYFVESPDYLIGGQVNPRYADALCQEQQALDDVKDRVRELKNRMRRIRGKMRNLYDGERIDGDESHGKSHRGRKKRKSYNKRSGKLAKYTNVYEFRRKLDFTVEADVRKYLDFLDGWLKEVNTPREYDNFVHFVRNYFKDKEHRVIAVSLLASRGNRVAQLFMKVHHRKINKEMFETWNYDETHGLFDRAGLVNLFQLGLASGVASIAGAVVAHYAPKATRAIAGGRRIAQVASTVTDVVDTVGEYARRVWRWMKEKFREIMAYFSFSNIVTSDIFRFMLKVIFAVVAFYYAATLFPSYYITIRTYIASKIHLDCSDFDIQVKRAEHVQEPVEMEVSQDDLQASPVEPQEGDESHGFEDKIDVLSRILEFIRKNVAKVPRALFWDYLGILPKFSNAAKAIEYLLTKSVWLYNKIVEMWTGTQMPESQTEADVLEFAENVDKISITIAQASADILTSRSLEVEMDTLDEEKRRLMFAIKKETRHHFVRTFSEKTNLLGRTKEKYKLRRRVAKQRPVPVFVLLRGGPGIGKSTFVHYLTRRVVAYVKEFQDEKDPVFEEDVVYDPSMMYVWNQADNYWDGYREQFVCFIDELFQILDTEKRCPIASQMLNIVSPVPFPLLVATPEDKGERFFTSRLIVATSNMDKKDLDFKTMDLGIMEPDALKDRISICVEIDACSKGKEPEDYTFTLDDGFVYDNMRYARLSGAQLADLVGEMILSRHSQRNIPPKVGKPERFTGSFKGGRITLSGKTKGDQSHGGLGDRDKGKEKVKEIEDEEELPDEDTPVWGLDGFEIPKCSIDMTKCTSAGRALAFRLRLDDPVDVESCAMFFRLQEQVPVSNLEEYEDSKSRFRVLKYVPGFVRGYLFRNHLEMVCPKMPRRGYDLYNLIQSQRVMRKYEEALDNPVPYEERIATTKDDYDLFMRILGDTWNQANCRTYYNCEAIDYKFWRTMEDDWGEALKRAEENPRAFRLKMENRTGIYVLLAAAGGAVALAAAGVAWALSTFMPGRAYDDETHGAYPTEGAAKGQKRVVRQVRKRANARWRMKGTPASHGALPSNYQNLVDHIDYMEIRTGDRSETWDQVKDRPALTGSYILFIGGRTAIVPMHVVYSQAEPNEEIWISLRRNVQYHVRESALLDKDKEALTGDLGLLTFPGMEERTKITGYFADDFPSFGPYERLKPMQGGTFVLREPVSVLEPKRHFVPVNATYGEQETNLVAHGICGEPGDCGLPYVHKKSGKIVGIHMGGNRNIDVAYVVSVFKKQVEERDKQFPEFLEPYDLEFEESHGLKGVRVLGKVSSKWASWLPKETNIKESRFDRESFPVPETTDRPARLREADGISPLINALNKYGLQETVEPIEEVSVDDAYPRSFCAGNIRELTLEEALYGTGDGYIDAIDFTTSAGHTLKKMGHTRYGLTHTSDGKQRVHPLLRRMVEVKMKAFKEGKICPVVYEETLKDEIRSYEKWLEGNTRLFSAGDFVSFLIQRMVLGTFVAEMHKDPVNSPFGVKINVHSKDWGQLWARLYQDGQVDLGAGDFVNFDIGLKVHLMERYIVLVRKYHYDPDLAERVIKANFYGWHFCGRVVYVRPWGTSSGSFITTSFNTFSNWYMHKHAWCAIYPETEFGNAQFTFTGDDSVFTVPKRYEKYNMEYLKDYFWRVFRMRYTAPDKTNKTHVTWEELTYLKRRFVTGHMGMMAPLALKSIANMIKWTENDSPEVMESVLNSVMLEAFHYGKEFFDECYVWGVQESKRMNTHFKFPNWLDLINMRRKDYQ